MTIEYLDGQIRPIGTLREILDKFNAPERVRRIMAKRIGSVVGPNGVPYEYVEKTIARLTPNGKGTNWQAVKMILGEAAGRVYQGKHYLDQ